MTETERWQAIEEALRMSVVALEDEERCEGLMETGRRALDAARAALSLPPDPTPDETYRESIRRIFKGEE